MTVINVASYGAKANDSIDDTAAIQRAIAASREGDVLSFGTGRYTLSGTLDLLSNRTYQGDAGAVLARTGSSVEPLMSIEDARNVTVTGLTFDGRGITLDGDANDGIKITKNVFQNIYGGDFGDADGVFSAARLTNSSISDNRFTNIGVKSGQYQEESSAIRGYHLDHTTISGNSFDTVNQGVSLLWDTQAGDGVTIENNAGLRVHRMGIEALGDPAVTNLVVRDNSFGEFLDPWGGSFGLSIVVDGGTGTRIEGNKIFANKTAISGEHYGFGIEVGGHNTVVQNNTVAGDWYSSVALGSAPGAQVQNNLIVGTASGVMPAIWNYENSAGMTSTGNSVLSMARVTTGKGGTAAEFVSATSGADSIDGGKGNDFLYGGGGGDTFVVKAGNGSDTILDFAADDKVSLDGFGFGDTGKVVAALKQSGANVTLALGNGETLTFAGTQLSAIKAAQFSIAGATTAPPAPTPPAPVAAATTIAVNASGVAAGGANAHFKLLVDGQKVGDATVGTAAKTFTFTTSVTADQAHKVQIQYDNDAVVNGQDRSLYVNKVTINGHAVNPTDGNVTYDKGALDGKDVVKGQPGLWWNGTLVVSADKSFFPSATTAGVATAQSLDAAGQQAVYQHVAAQAAHPAAAGAADAVAVNDHGAGLDLHGHAAGVEHPADALHHHHHLDAA